MNKENNYILLLKKEYENLFSDCLKGKVPTNIRLDTEALTNLLALENVAQIEASIRKYNTPQKLDQKIVVNKIE